MKTNEFQTALESTRNHTPYILTREVEGKTYKRKIIGRDRLVIFGGGHVSQAVCKLATMANFDVTIVDDRPMFANSRMFPDAAEIICDSFPNALDHRVKITENDYVCTLTRGHRFDADCIRHVMKHTMPYYLGMMGSKRRVRDFLEVLKEEGFPQDRIDALHSPIGISIGAKTPMEIGFSIMAEIIREKYKQEADSEYLPESNLEPETLEFLANAMEPRAFVMLLSTEGSTPAKAGAIMGVDHLGRTYGTVGGGCTEAALITRARRLLGTKKTAVVTLDMTGEVAEEKGMVCGGVAQAYIEDLT